MMNQISLNNLSFIYPKHTIQIDKYFIPILIDMKNIYINQIEELKIGLIGKEDPFSIEYDKIKLINRFENIMIHINTTDKLYNNYTMNFLEYNSMKNIRELLYILSDYELVKITNHIDEIIPFMVSEYRKRLHASLKLDEKEPSISYTEKHKMPENIKEYLSYTEFYILCQTVIEFNPTPLFPENKDKTISEWSLREYELHMAYITAKFRFDSVQNKWSMKLQDDISKSK